MQAEQFNLLRDSVRISYESLILFWADSRARVTIIVGVLVWGQRSLKLDRESFATSYRVSVIVFKNFSIFFKVF